MEFCFGLVFLVFGCFIFSQAHNLFHTNTGKRYQKLYENFVFIFFYTVLLKVYVTGFLIVIDINSYNDKLWLTLQNFCYTKFSLNIFLH